MKDSILREDLAQLDEYIRVARNELGSADCDHALIHSCLRCALIRIESMQGSLPNQTYHKWAHIETEPAISNKDKKD